MKGDRPCTPHQIALAETPTRTRNELMLVHQQRTKVTTIVSMDRSRQVPRPDRLNATHEQHGGEYDHDRSGEDASRMHGLSALPEPSATRCAKGRPTFVRHVLPQVRLRNVPAPSVRRAARVCGVGMTTRFDPDAENSRGYGFDDAP